MKRINIMTSCNDAIAEYLLPQLVSINRHLSGYDLYFYLTYNNISEEKLNLIKDFVKSKTCINYFEIKVENISFYESFVRDGDGFWPCEAYFTLRLQDYMPDDVDRILYIDAGDVIIDGDISPYYFDDFEGNSFIATTLGHKKIPETGELEPYTQEDIMELRRGTLFNSGSYIIDVEKFRREGYTENDYDYLRKLLRENSTKDEIPYLGDQGFLAAAFVGDIKFFGYPQCKDPSYMPYNFRTCYWAYFGNDLNYKPVVYHYAIRSKPWVVRFDDEVIDRVVGDPNFVGRNLVTAIPTLTSMTPQHLKACEVWWEYAKETPIYEEADVRARITAESWEKYYFPLCAQYNGVYAHLLRLMKIT